jgi:hypothetical protein
MHRKFASLIRQMDGFKLTAAPVGNLCPSAQQGWRLRGNAPGAGDAKLGELFKPIEKAGKLREKKFIPEIGKSLSRGGSYIDCAQLGQRDQPAPRAGR